VSMELHSPTTVVLGMGNLIHSDDGVGVHAVQRLQADRRVPAEVLLLDGGTLGLTLLNRVSGAKRLLIIDAVDIGAPAGTMVRMEGKELRGMPGSGSVHQLGFADLLAALSFTGQEPEELVVIGIQPASTNVGASLSPPVAAVLDEVVAAALAQLWKWWPLVVDGRAGGDPASATHTWEDTCTNSA
jgi:hydrogenase maturation protease